MTKLLIDAALIVIALTAARSMMGSLRQFTILFVQLRAEMAAGLPVQSLHVTVRSTGVTSGLEPVGAMVFQPGINVANNPAGTLAVRPRLRRRPAVMRAAA